MLFVLVASKPNNEIHSERPDERLLQRLRGFRRGTVEWLDGFASQSHEVLGAQHGMFDTWTNAICANLRLRHETSWIIITNRIDDYSRCHD
ncbi:hypothetical protein Y032_0196g1512 [Ancylostoma ceylanicum]|uniref:Uncharacterized protein n=1 Tax=Ancylostoma ceylanicum TaxID=53326 RepID=A0A016SNE1_9BILA|nr:hypothetical protein Y032_0196g1512 [Ancylostoma ceylanicum]